MRMTRRFRRGLSLIDVVISIAILMVLATLGTTTMLTATKISRILEQREQVMRSAMPQIRDAVRLAFLTPNITAVESYKTVFVGKNDDPDILFLSTQSHRRLYRNTRECDQTEITLWTESMPDGSPGYVLYQREAPRIDEEPDKGGTIQPLAYNVKSFDLRYLDNQNNEWRNDWDSQGVDTPNRLPRAVEISMVTLHPDLKDPDEWVEKNQKATVVLVHSKPVVRSALEASGFGQ